MPLLGSEEAGLGSVLTAAGNAGGGNTPSGNGTAIAGKFSAISGDAVIPTTVYMDDAASAGVVGSATPLQYPAPAMTITGLRLGAPVGTGANPPTATLMKNGVATAITCALPPGAAAGANVADTAHSVTFAAGDRFDVRLAQPIAAEGAAPFVATIEGSVSSGGGGGGFPGYGPAPPAVAAGSAGGVSALVSRADHTHAQSFGGAPGAVGPSSAGIATTASRSDHTHATLSVANRAALAALSAATMSDGTQCWVQTYGGVWFELQTSSLTVDTNTIIAAAGAPTKQWIRLQLPYRQNWQKLQWYVDPTTGSDENAGDIGTPLATCAEWNRRTFQALWTATVTLNLVTDVANGDDIIVTAIGPVNCDIRGQVTVLSTNAVTAAQAKASATNLANQITTVADLSAHVGRLLRVQGTSNYAVITKAVSAGVLRLGELWNVTTDALASTTGVAAAQTIEVMDFTKGPLNLKIANQCAVRVFNVQFGTGTGSCVFRNLTSEPVSLRGARISAASMINNHGFSTNNWSAVSVNPSGAFTTSGAQELSYRACAFVGATAANITARKASFKSTVFQGVPISLFAPSCNIDQDLGIFDLAAGVAGLDINQDSYTPTLRWTDGRYYGGGNNVTAIGIRMSTQARIQMNASAPVMDAGIGVQLGYLPTSQNVPFAQWPLIWDATMPVALKFSGGLATDPVLPSASYMADPGVDIAPTNAQPQRYPTSSRLMLRLRVTFISGGPVAVTVTLYKNAVATLMTVTIPNTAVPGNKFVDSSHAILFADGDDFDLRMDCAGGVGGTTLVSAVLEGAI